MELRTNSYKMSARMRSNTSIGKCSAGPSGGSSLFHVRHLAGVFSFKGQKPDCFFWGGRCPRKN